MGWNIMSRMSGNLLYRNFIIIRLELHVLFIDYSNLLNQYQYRKLHM